MNGLPRGAQAVSVNTMKVYKVRKSRETAWPDFCFMCTPLAAESAGDNRYTVF